LRLARGVKNTSEVVFWTAELNKIKKQEAKS